MSVDREAIMEALKALIDAQGRFKTISRKFVLWDNVPQSAQPACYFLEPNEDAGHQSENLGRLTMRVELFLYSRADNPEDIPVSILNADLGAIDDAIAPRGRDAVYKRQTLGSRVSHCYVDGDVIKMAGDLDQQNVSVVPIKILVP